MNPCIHLPYLLVITNRQIPALFSNLHNLEEWNVRIDMRPQLWVSVQTWTTVELEGTPFLCIIIPYILRALPVGSKRFEKTKRR